jgi:rare lipoprotein A
LSVLLPAVAVACCTPHPRFFTSYDKPSSAIEAHTPAATPKPPAEKQSQTLHSAPSDKTDGDSLQKSKEPLRLDTAALQSSWASAFEKPSMPPSAEIIETGVAVWYGPGFRGKKTASGERFDKNKCTAAHKTLPFNSLVKVTNLDNGLSVVVRINDRGPFGKNYCIDLSQAAAQRIGLDISGMANVRIETVQQ